MALTALEVRSAKGRKRPYKVSDAGGLYLFVQPSGQRYWRLAYRCEGKQQTMALGVYPDVSLVDARAKRDSVRKQLAEGKTPVSVAREKELAAKPAEQIPFRARIDWRGIVPRSPGDNAPIARCPYQSGFTAQIPYRVTAQTAQRSTGIAWLENGMRGEKAMQTTLR